MGKDKDKKSSRFVEDASAEYKILEDKVIALAKQFEDVLENTKNMSKDERAKMMQEIRKAVKGK